MRSSSIFWNLNPDLFTVGIIWKQVREMRDPRIDLFDGIDNEELMAFYLYLELLGEEKNEIQKRLKFFVSLELAERVHEKQNKSDKWKPL